MLSWYLTRGTKRKSPVRVAGVGSRFEQSIYRIRVKSVATTSAGCVTRPYYLHRFDSRTWRVLVSNDTERTLKEDAMAHGG